MGREGEGKGRKEGKCWMEGEKAMNSIAKKGHEGKAREKQQCDKWIRYRTDEQQVRGRRLEEEKQEEGK